VLAQNLTRQFGEHRALANISLEIEPGESFGLLGANGAGKTTFIRLVTGFLLPSSGEISVDGHSPVLEARTVQERLGFVAETSHLYPELKVAPFLRFAGGIRGLSGTGLNTAVAQVLDRFDLASVCKRRIGNLSKGFQQRVSLAQAFLHQPRLLIVDEPTSGLDPIQRVDVQDTLADLRGECTLLLCTHDLDEARVLTQRCAILYAGKLVAIGPTQEILAEGRNLDLFRGSVTRDAQAGPPS
jgi:ABC-2 type transport system ATP-binding protein